MAHPSSSSSASTANSQYYDVFINHRGEVKLKFATPLYEALISSGLQVFLDKREMQVGQGILPQINAAIEVASVHVAIFSPLYAESNWCLDELLLMVKSKATIVPVFYDVNPSDLRWTGKEKHGPYAEALRKHEEKKRYNLQTIQNWRDALSVVSHISGLELQAFNGDKDELLDKLVQRVLQIRPPSLDLPKYHTGLDEKLEEFERMVLSQQEGESRMKVAAIVGIGGLGKTTLAKYFFNRKRSQYDRSSFLSDVREKAAQKDLNSLLSKLIKDLKHRDIKIEGEQGSEILKNTLSSSRALIILDDVDDVDQLEALLQPIEDVLDPNSLIVVTSRNMGDIIGRRWPESSIYPLTALNPSQSEELFCNHAFFERRPLPGFKDLIDGFVAASFGLPLALMVFGALVRGNDKPYWQEQLNGLHKLPKEIMERLKISYNSLDDDDKQIFLDIACFSIGEYRDKWMLIWSGSGWKGLVGFRNLQNKSLVEVDTENKIRMHDLLRDLGRNIAEEAKPLRLWGATTQNINSLLKKSYAGITKVRGIRMAPRSTLQDKKSKAKMILDRISSQGMFGFSELQLLDAEGDFVESILPWVQSPELIWLRWNDCACSSLPSSLPMDDLRVLEVAGKELKKLWQSESEAPMELRELNVNAPLLKFPNSLGELEHLEKLVAEETNLETLPKEFCCMPCLKYLKLKDYKMQIIPASAGKVTNLKLSQGRGLQNLPYSMRNSTNLQLSDLQQCKNLEMLLTAAAWRRSQIPSGNKKSPTQILETPTQSLETPKDRFARLVQKH